MIYLFLRLFLLILLSFLLFNYLGLNPINYIRSQQSESYITKQLAGIQFHLIDTLQALTPEQRQQWVRQNNHHFNYRLMLGRINDLSLTDGRRKKLQQNKAVFQSPFLHMPFPDSEQVLGMRVHGSNVEGYTLSARGAVWLLQQKVAPYEDVHQGLKSIQDFFTYPVNAFKAEEIELTGDQWYRLREDGLIVVYTKGDNRGYLIYSQYETPEHGSWIIRAGPVDESAVVHNFILLGMLSTAFILLVPVLFWLLWFWFDLRKFQRTSHHYGSGRLDARLQIRKGSALYLPSQSFNQMADALQKLIEGHKTLVNAVSHELKTPVARLNFALEILRDATDEDEKNHAEGVLQQNINELEAHIQELLLYARYERSITLKMLDRDAALQWLADIGQRFQEIYPELTLSVETSQLNQLHIDQQAMRHLLNNLLSNAAEHSKKQVLITLESDKKHFILTVEDDGPGVPEEWREKIFEPFSRPDNSRQRATGGRGLGLAIVWQIASQHGGEVVCDEGQTLQGARFSVKIRCRS